MTDPLSDLARLEGIPSAVTAARDGVDAILRDRGLRKISAETTATALLASAQASAQLEGDDRWLPGAIRLSTELIELSALIRKSPAQAIARAHALLAHGLVADDDLGRARPGAEIAERLVGLNHLLTEPTAASAVVVAAIAHAELASIAPFGGGDGVIARAVEHMILVEGGVDPRAVIVIEAGHLAGQAAYRQALGAYQSGTPEGVRAWLLHCSSALSYGVEVSPLRG